MSPAAENPNPGTPSNDPPATSNPPSESSTPHIEENDQVGEDEEGECGFCLFMKGGGCRDEFVAWENCVEEAEKKGENIADKCYEVTAKLRQCMEAHADYYEPILRAEKAMEEEAAQELGQETKAPDGVREEIVEIEVVEPARVERREVHWSFSFEDFAHLLPFSCI